MSRKHWKGGAAGQINNWLYDGDGGHVGSNWVDAAGVGCAKPVAGDDAEIDTGSADIAGIDLSSLTLNTLVIHEGAGSVGADGTPMRINASAGLEAYGGDVYLQGNFCVSSGTAIIMLPTAQDVCEITGVVSAAQVLRGNVTLNVGGQLNLLVASVTNPAGDATVTITNAGGLTLTSVEQMAGIVNSPLPVNQGCMLYGGVFNQQAGDPGAQTIFGGVYNLLSTFTTGQIILAAYGGTFDARKSSGPIAIHAGSVQYAAAKVYLNNGGGRLSGSMRCFGTTPVVDDGTTLAFNA